MTPEERQDERFGLLYCAEYSTRYHRRRAHFLGNLDTLLNLITAVSGASTVVDLAAGTPGWIAKVGAALITAISITQILLRIGAHASAHTQWMKRWTKLQTDIKLTPEPNNAQISAWLEEKADIETDCVGELRALCNDCENAAAKVMRLEGRQVRIKPLQRLLLHFGTYQSDFPPVPDRPALPK